VRKFGVPSVVAINKFATDSKAEIEEVLNACRVEGLTVNWQTNGPGVPKGFTIPVRELRFSFGTEFIVVLTGDIMTMPGLPRVPAANAIGIDDHGKIFGLFK